MAHAQQQGHASQQTRLDNLPFGGFAAARPVILSIAKLFMLGIAGLPILQAAPTRHPPFSIILEEDEDGAIPPENPTLWIYLAVAVGLVLLGGAFAGLTIALMGQDEIYLQVIKTSGDGAEKKHASKVLRLLKRGKHWVLVTLLLGNVITNETLPIILDRSLGGGWPAVLGSTVLIVIFGEIIPQSICVRYGLPIGAWMSPLVVILMYILAPVAWPTAKLLDWLLGEDHGTTYKKAGLKTLVTLHKTLGMADEQLNSDEVTIITAVLDLKEKPVGSIMTPMADVFTMSSDTVLDEDMMDEILSAGYSRIPIHTPNNERDFVGMLLVKMLITYDPDDGTCVSEFALATLPETSPETSCLDIMNFFQEGKSHMVLISEFPGTDSGALGVVTLEDVIEELIGEEIIDESDVFIDVHKAIRRMTPAPRLKVPKGEVVTEPSGNVGAAEENLIDMSEDKKNHDEGSRGDKNHGGRTIKANGRDAESGASPKTISLLRRPSSTAGASDREGGPKRANTQPMRGNIKHLGPSNLASRPRQTRYNTVKIKPGGGTLKDGIVKSQEPLETPRRESMSAVPQGGVGAGLLSSAGKEASDGVLAIHTGYGTMDRTPPTTPKASDNRSKGYRADEMDSPTPQQGEGGRGGRDKFQRPKAIRSNSTQSTSTVGSMHSRNGNEINSPRRKKGIARSGSITENIIEAGGIKKVVLETTSSSEDAEGKANGDEEAGGNKENSEAKNGDGVSQGGKKKRRRKRKKGGKDDDGGVPLLERDESG